MNDYPFSVGINIFNRVIGTICIRTHIKCFVRLRILRQPTRYIRIVESSAVIQQTRIADRLLFLAVEMIVIVVNRFSRSAPRLAEGIVIAQNHQFARMVDQRTRAAQMIANIIDRNVFLTFGQMIFPEKALAECGVIQLIRPVPKSIYQRANVNQSFARIVRCRELTTVGEIPVIHYRLAVGRMDSHWQIKKIIVDLQIISTIKCNISATIVFYTFITDSC